MFTAISAAFSLIVYIAASGGKLDFNTEIIGYSIAFAIPYSMATIGNFLAIKHGPLSLTAFISQYSLLIPTFYGLIAYDEPCEATLIIGIILMAVSLFLVKKKGDDSDLKCSAKWLFWLIISFVGNGCCSTVQKIQQYNFNGLYKSEFMIVAISISVATMLTISLLTEKQSISQGIKGGILFIALCGLANGGVNFGTMVLTNRMPTSVMFPVISASSTIVVTAVSLIFYKERLSKLQILGVALGIIAIIAMNS